MSRKLAAVTIIPPELYVERAADRQLRAIVEGMGRPGYVLVARQMGKTNLLLNARRSLEKPDCLFVYVDLSAKLETLEHYFGLLLNTAYAVHPQLFEGQGVDLSRDSYPPAVFESVLRSVLRVYRGRIVFVLDEIDSLAHYAFSDRVFSQIRSMYFSRANFPDYGRVTYVLSGVAEPAELIKDKNVSPFNIGQKIFLNDFTEEEFWSFLKKAELSLPKNVIDRVYHWAGGNPRISWDICSEVEELAVRGDVTVDDIDSVVSSLYLTAFDRAPVDHIRTLAQTDREIRAAIRSLRSNQILEIPDHVRNKLYLAGITNIQSEGAGATVLKIKNEIIDASLSDRWLRDVERQSRNILQLARENYEEKLYEPAVAFFDEYLADNDIEFGSPDAYRVGFSYFSTRRYEKAIDWLTRYAEMSDSAEVRTDVIYMVGRSNLAVGNFVEAATAFREVVASGSKAHLPIAQGLLASSLLQIDVEAHHAEICELCESALLHAETISKPEQKSIARVVALLNLTTIEEAEGNHAKALELLGRAEAEQAPAYRPIIVLATLRHVEDPKRKAALLDELADSIMSGFAAPQEMRFDASNEVIVSALVTLRLNDRHADFDRLLEFYLNSKEGMSSGLPSVYLSLYNAAAKTSGKDAAVFLKDLIEKFRDQPAALDSVLNATRMLLIVQGDASIGAQYLSTLAKQASSEITDADHIALSVYMRSVLRNDNVEALLEFDSLPHAVALQKVDPTLGEIYHASFEVNRLERLGRISAAVNLAKKLIVIMARNTGAASAFSEKNRNAILATAQEIVDRYSRSNSSRANTRKYGRNSEVKVAYPDGRIVIARFKSVQRDIALGECKIVDGSEEDAG